MNLNKPWTEDEENRLLVDVSNGVDLSTIAQKHGRSVKAIEMRLQKIIYENHTKGRPLESIARLLNLNLEQITNYYNSYKQLYEEQYGTKQIQTPNVQTGGNNVQKMSRLEKIEAQNRILKAVIEQEKLKQTLTKMIKRGEVDPDIRKIIKKISHEL